MEPESVSLIPDPWEAALLVRRAFERTPRVHELVDLARKHDVGLHLVGGFVRDVILGTVEQRDLDFALSREGISLANAWGRRIGGALVPLDPGRGTYRVAKKLAGRLWYWDFTALRGDDIEEDLRRRDFTVNSMALPLHPPGERLLDPTGGLSDLAGRIIRHAGPAAFIDDPLRKLRAFRLAAQLDFTIHPETAALLAGEDLTGPVSGERIREELGHLLASPRAAPLTEQLVRDGLLASLWPRGGPDLALLAGLERIASDARRPAGPLSAFLDHHNTHGLTRLVLLKLVCLTMPPGSVTRPPPAVAARLAHLNRALILGRSAARFQSQALDAVTLLRSGGVDLETPEGPWIFFDRCGLGGLGGIVLHAAGGAQPVPANPARWADFHERVYLPDLKQPRLLPAAEVSLLSGVPPGPELGRLLDELNLVRRTGRIKDADQARAWVAESGRRVIY